MKKILFICVTVFSMLSCSKQPSVSKVVEADVLRDFYENGVHVTIKSGCALETKSAGVDEYMTIKGEKGDVSYTLYAALTYQEGGFSVYEAITECGSTLGTFVYCNNILVNFEPSPEIESIALDDTIATKARKEGEKYGACVVREAKELNKRIDEDPINAAACDVAPCHIVTLVVSAVECTKKE